MKERTRGPSVLDDAAAVWAASIARRPVAWTLGTAALALAANVVVGPRRSLFAVAVAPVLAGSLWSARRAPGLIRTSWLLLIAVACVHAPALWYADAAAGPPLVAVVAAAAAGALWASQRRRGAGWWDLAIVTAASAFNWFAAPLAATREGFAVSPGWVVALVAAVLVAPSRAWLLGAVPLAVLGWLRAGEMRSLTYSFLDHALASVGWAFVLALASRAGRAAVGAPDGDAAACRLALRAHRRPWAVLCLGATFGPGADVLSHTMAGGSWWSVTGPRELAGSAALHVALASPTPESFVRSIAAWSVRVVLWGAWFLWVAAISRPGGSQPFLWDWVFVHGYAPLLLGWVVGGAAIGARSLDMRFVAGLSFSFLAFAHAPLADQLWGALHLPGWTFLAGWVLAWRVLFHTAVIASMSVRTLLALAFTGGLLLGLVNGPAGLAVARAALVAVAPEALTLARDAPPPPLGLLTGLLAVVPLVFWVIVAQRIRSMTPVPPGHPASRPADLQTGA